MTSTTRHGDEEREPDHVLGLVTDPDMPTQSANETAQRVVDWLEEETGEQWAVEVVSDPVTAGHPDSDQILRAVAKHRERNDWRFAICVTDLPLLLRKGILLADVSTERGVGLMSLPMLGALLPRRRTYRVMVRILNDLLGNSGPDIGKPFVRSTHDDSVDVRYMTTNKHGGVRLMTGMVRGNRPWTLMWGLSSALAAALAAAGFGVFTSTVWQIGDVLGPLRALGTMLFAIGLMTGWLIAAHGLWERVGRRAVRDRRLALLYNASTVTTLSVGVSLLYLVVYLVCLVAGVTLLDSRILESTLVHPVDWTTYFRLAWMVASMAILAGALGSSLESDAAVRQAAYGYREEQRRAEQAELEADEQAEQQGKQADRSSR